MPINPFDYNPLIQAAYHTGKQPAYQQSQQKEGYEPTTPTSPPEADAPVEMDNKSMLQNVGSTALSTVSAAANVLDLPGSMVRDVATWIPGGTPAANPLDQLLDPFGKNAHLNRVEGRQLLRDHGLVGKKDTWGNFAAGLAVDIATDPFTFFGTGVASRAGKAMEMAGLTKNSRRMIKEMAEAGGKNPTLVGKAGSKYLVTGNRVLDHIQELRESALKKVGGKLGKRTGGKSDEVYESTKSLSEAMPPEKAGPGSWAVVDDGESYKIMKVNEAAEGGVMEWVNDPDATKEVAQFLSTKSYPGTFKKARRDFETSFQAKYKDGFDITEELNKPLYSMASFKVPFTDMGRVDVFAKDADNRAKKYFGKLDDIEYQNKPDPGRPRGDAGGPGTGTAEPSPQPAGGGTGPKPGPAGAAAQAAGAAADTNATQAADGFTARGVDESWSAVADGGTEGLSPAELAAREVMARGGLTTKEEFDQFLREFDTTDANAIEPLKDRWAKAPKGDEQLGPQSTRQPTSKPASENTPSSPSSTAAQTASGPSASSRLGPQATRVLNEILTAAESTKAKDPEILKDIFSVEETVAETWAATLNDLVPEGDFTADDYFQRYTVEKGGKVEKGARTLNQDLQQRYGKTPKGRIQFTEEGSIISVFKNADESTFLHESAHRMRAMFPEEIQVRIREGITERASQLAGDFDAKSIPELAAKLKANKVENYTKMNAKEALEALGETSVPILKEDGSLTRFAEELYAEAWESYLKTGESPVKGLQAIFAKMKEMLTRIYENVTGKPGLATRVSPKLKSYFDDLLKGESLVANTDEVAATGRKADVAAAAATAAKNAPENAQDALGGSTIESTQDAAQSVAADSAEEFAEQMAADDPGVVDALRAEGYSDADIKRMKLSEADAILDELDGVFDEAGEVGDAEMSRLPTGPKPQLNSYLADRATARDITDAAAAPLPEAPPNNYLLNRSRAKGRPSDLAESQAMAARRESGDVSGEGAPGKLFEAASRGRNADLPTTDDQFAPKFGRGQMELPLEAETVRPRGDMVDVAGEAAPNQLFDAAARGRREPLPVIDEAFDLRPRQGEDALGLEMRTGGSEFLNKARGRARQAEEPRRAIDGTATPPASAAVKPTAPKPEPRPLSPVEQAAVDAPSIDSLQAAGIGKSMSELLLRRIDKMAPGSPELAEAVQTASRLAKAVRGEAVSQGSSSWDKLKDAVKAQLTERIIRPFMGLEDPTDVDLENIIRSASKGGSGEKFRQIKDILMSQEDIARKLGKVVVSDDVKMTTKERNLLDRMNKPVEFANDFQPSQIKKRSELPESLSKEDIDLLLKQMNYAKKAIRSGDQSPEMLQARNDAIDALAEELTPSVDEMMSYAASSGLRDTESYASQLQATIERIIHTHNPLKGDIQNQINSAKAKTGIDEARSATNRATKEVSVFEKVENAADAAPSDEAIRRNAEPLGEEGLELQDGIAAKLDKQYNAMEVKAAQFIDGEENAIGFRVLRGEDPKVIAEQVTKARRAVNPKAKEIKSNTVTKMYANVVEKIADRSIAKHSDILDDQEKSVWKAWLNAGGMKAEIVSGRAFQAANTRRKINSFLQVLRELDTPRAPLVRQLRNGIKLSDIPEEIMDGISRGIDSEALEVVERGTAREKFVKLASFKKTSQAEWKKTLDKTAEMAGIGSRDIVDRTLLQTQRKMRKAGELFQQEPDLAERSINQAAYRIQAATWNQIIDHLQRNKQDGNWLVAALDAGDNLFWSNPVVRRFRSLFDHRVFGAYEYEAQMVAEARYDAFEEAIFEMREQIEPIIRIAGKTGMLDETATLNSIIKNSPSTPPAAARKQARDLLNKRNSAVIQFMELNKPLDTELFNDPKSATELENTLGALKALFGDRLDAEAMAGLKGAGLHDMFVEYAPRNLYRKGRIMSKSARSQTLFDASQESQRMRRIYLRDIPGGRAVLDEISMDPDISGILHKKDVIGGKIEKELLDETVETMIEKYGRSGDGDGLLHPDMLTEDGKLTKDAQTKMRGLASSMMNLPLEHVEKQIPMYGRNFIHDFARYLENSYTKEAVALSAGDMVASNLRTGEKATLISKLFNEIKLDNHQAYMNAITKSGKLDAYNAFRENEISELLEKAAKDGGTNVGNGQKIIARDDKAYLLTKDQVKDLTGGEDVIESAREVTEDQIEQIISLGKKFADAEEMSVTQEAYDSAKFYLKPWSSPQEIGAVRDLAQRSLNMFKTFVTVPFPAFHGRNFISGQFQNFFYGLYDPSGTGPGRYTRPIQQAFAIRSGGTVKGISNQVPKNVLEDARFASPGLTDDEAVTEYMRKNVFQFGITGDKQGIAAEEVGDSVSSYMSQLPGSSVPDERNLRNLFGILRAPNPDATLLDRLNPLQTRGGARPVIDRSGARPAIALEASETTNFTPARIGEDLAQATEDINRIAPFISLIKQGYSPKEAARHVQKVQIDYSTLSEAEKRIKEFIPFYTFSSRVLPLTFGDLITNPGGKQRRAIQLTAEGQGPEEPTPEYMQRGTAVPLGQMEDGTRRYLTGLGLAFEDPLDLAGILTGDAGSTASALISRVRPEIQALGELATGRSFFNERPLEDLDPPIGRFISNITGGERKGNAEPFISSGVEFIANKLPTSRVVSTLNSLTDERKSLAPKMLNTLTGIKITDVSPESQSYIAANRALELLKEMGAREGGFTYIPDWQKARMTPEELAQAEGIMTWMNDVKREAKKRAEASENLANSLANATDQ